jgi:LacI family transcriptional regulator
MAATIRDVAAAAGVSTATVSRALHAGAGVSPRTRLRVEEAARRLEYRPSATAARLASGRHGAVAFVVRGPLLSSGAEVLDGVCSTLAGAGLDCSLHLVPQEAEFDASLLADLAGRVDAAVVLAHTRLPRPPALPLPVVAVCAEVPGVPGAFVDLAAAASLAAGHLAAARYRQVAVLSDAGAGGDALARLVESAAWAGGGRVRVVRHVAVAGAGSDDAARAAATVLADPSPPDALLCTSDRLVRGAARALQLQGLMAGDDVGLLGIGGEQTGIDLEVSMVVEPRQLLGAAAAALAAELAAGAPATGERVLLAPQLMLRWSTARRRRILA